MNRIYWPLLLLAFLATASILAYGVAVAQRSFLIAIIATVVLVLSFKGASMYRKKKIVPESDGSQ
ncbi:DUF5325 family protein [Natribacillus halophilus]|uniref:Uncharacterized protein n=1 Tax=Natribacillus halophilus TaxID=549003 RepID=A0A1G8MC08_9BACI|nr:DUF5325 family protein [Natribacillus halophilus]SDI65385.1 hypothetical protein SAMN04488123_10482 [Natribacillus halophilus]